MKLFIATLALLTLNAGPLAAASETLYIPASASIHGSAGTFFQTDLWATNRSFTNTLTVSARLRCSRGACTGTTKELTLAPRETKQLSDVVGTFFGQPESAGAIELTFDNSIGKLSATTRTYTPSLPAPTFGSAIPALAAADVKTRVLFQGIGGSGGDRSTGFRTNVGAYNPFPLGTSMTFSLYDERGRLLGTRTEQIAPNEARQLDDVFAAVGAASVVTTNATVVAETSLLPLFFYATVIDNQSGDSVWAVPSADEAPPAP
jgi:hypothetical protein